MGSTLFQNPTGRRRTSPSLRSSRALAVVDQGHVLVARRERAIDESAHVGVSPAFGSASLSARKLDVAGSGRLDLPVVVLEVAVSAFEQREPETEPLALVRRPGPCWRARRPAPGARRRRRGREVLGGGVAHDDQVVGDRHLRAAHDAAVRQDHQHLVKVGYRAAPELGLQRVQVAVPVREVDRDALGLALLTLSWPSTRGCAARVRLGRELSKMLPSTA